MRFQWRTFWLAKDVQYADEYQDAAALDPRLGLAAIADGVASAIYSGLWARILARAAVAEPPELGNGEQFQAWLQRQRQVWSSQIDVSHVPWNVRPKLIHGAMTTLLWIALEPRVAEDGTLAGHYQLHAAAIGDCCLFHYRQGKLVRIFPIQRAADFGLDPAVIGSIDRKQDHLLEFHLADDTCCPGDLLVLATDALAQWAVTRLEVGQPIAWDGFWQLSDEAWRDWVMGLRDAAAIRYDDTTLVLLHVLDPLASGEPHESEASPLIVIPPEPTREAAGAPPAAQADSAAGAEGSPGEDDGDEEEIELVIIDEPPSDEPKI